jgi:SAM-dependent methyltransferase
MTTPVYDEIGRGYARHRRPDSRVAEAIAGALGGAQTVVNVGAGSGSYEPRDRDVTAVEPSAEMIAQRPGDAARVVQGAAERLPFEDGAFDASMAVLTLHHWSDRVAGLSEMQRVARRVVILTWDPESEPFWLTRDYFPDIIALDRTIFPTMSELSAVLGETEVAPVPVPHDCIDGFLGAYWRRPEAYLDDSVRASISTFTRVPDVAPRIERLRTDLASSAWSRRNAHVLGLDSLDVGYRLVTAGR